MEIPLEHRLTGLVEAGIISDWRISDVDENGVEGQTGRFRNTQKLCITFSNGEKLEIGTFCSGCAENTYFV